MTESNPPGDIPDEQVFVPYTPPGGTITVKVPEGWARSESGGVVTFTDKLNSISIAHRPTAAALSAAEIQASVVPQLSSQVPQFTAGKITAVTRKAGPATLLTYQADSAPNPVTGKVIRDDVERYAFWKAGTEVVLTLSGPKGADNVDPWRIVTDSLVWQ